jgi:hypothetical protein
MVALLTLIMAPALAAQDSVIVIDPDAPPSTVQRLLPAEVLAEAVTRYNDSNAVRFAGDVSLPAGAAVRGPVGLFRGTLTVAGIVEGPVTVVNGDVVVLPGGQLLGDVLVVGGAVRVHAGGLHRGNRRTFAEVAEVYRDTEGQLQIRAPSRPLAELAAEQSFQVGDIKTTIKVALGGTYNRVEGLPLYLAPIFQWRPSDRDTLSLEVRGIIRTASDPSDLRKDPGYRVDLGWRSGAGPRWAVNLVAWSEIVGIEQQPLSRSENGWSAFVLQRDYRDWYQSQGVGATIGLSLASPLRMRLGIGVEEERSVQAGDPWSLIRNSDRWRPNPLIDDGRYGVGTIALNLDTRNSTSFPSSGWYAHAEYEHAWSDNVAPLDLPLSVRAPIPTTGTYSFGRVAFDIQRYVRINPAVRVGARLLAQGWVTGDDLPVQRRYSLGGTDILPGYPFRAVNCDPTSPGAASQVALCNRLLAVQAEVRTRLNFGWAFHLEDRERAELDRIIAIDQADLVFLADAGTAWIAGDGPGQVSGNHLPAGSQWKFDVGAGLDLGGVGFYLAKALTDSEPLRFTLRLQRRF